MSRYVAKSIYNNWCRTFWPHRPLSTAYKTDAVRVFFTQLTKAYTAETSCISCYWFCYVSALLNAKLILGRAVLTDVCWYIVMSIRELAIQNLYYTTTWMLAMYTISLVKRHHESTVYENALYSCKCRQEIVNQGTIVPQLQKCRVYAHCIRHQMHNSWVGLAQKAATPYTRSNSMR